MSKSKLNLDAFTKRKGFIYSSSPLLIYWELTRACSLVCKHCRASAINKRHPLELTTSEIKYVLKILQKFRPLPVLVLTGGDILQRNDLNDIINTATNLGFKVALSPSVTPLLTKKVIKEWKKLDISIVSLSLDGSNAEIHDSIRGINGCFNMTLEAAQEIISVGIPLQINTLVVNQNINDIPSIKNLIDNLEIYRWSLFFLINVGRGYHLKAPSSQQTERLLVWLSTIKNQINFQIKTTEALHYKRILLSKYIARGYKWADLRNSPLA